MKIDAYQLACLAIVAPRARVKGNVERFTKELDRAERRYAKLKAPNAYNKREIQLARERYAAAYGDYTDLLSARELASNGLLFSALYVTGRPSACHATAARRATLAEIRRAKRQGAHGLCAESP